MAHDRAARASAIVERRPMAAEAIARSVAVQSPPSAARTLQQRLGNQATHALVNRFPTGSTTASVVGPGGAENACSEVFSRDSTPPVASGDFDPPIQPQTAGRFARQWELRPDSISAKLTISQPGDAHEQEADRVADAVMRMREPALQTPTISPASASLSGHSVQRLCADCDDEMSQNTPVTNLPITRGVGQVQRKEESAATPQVTPSVSANIRALQGGGSPLPAATRAFFEPRFGADFSHVRVHTGARAEETAQSISAKAFTVGRDIAFAGGQYAPQSHEGRRLLAHELTHVVQQDGEQMHRARTQARERVTTGGVAAEQRKGPLNFLSTRKRLIAHELTHVVQQSSRSSSSAPEVMRRKVEAPTDEQLANDLLRLYMRLQSLQEVEERKGISTRELADTQREIAEKEALASEKDPIKRQILFCRTTLLELRDQLKVVPRSSKREEIEGKIGEYQSALADALSINIKHLEKEIKDLSQKFKPGDFGLATAINVAEKELMQNEAELKVLRRIFPSQKAEAYRLKSEKDIRPMPGGGCMTAVYKGVEALYSPAESSDIKKSVGDTAGPKGDKLVEAAKKRGVTNKDELDRIKGIPICVDLIMETMTTKGKAEQPVTLKYDRKKSTWNPSAAATVLGLIKPDFLGWYFFGMSLSGGFHSVILAVDNSQGGDPQIYWMDQFSKGFKNNVTKTLEKTMKAYEPPYGYADTRIWPLLPPSSGSGAP